MRALGQSRQSFVTCNIYVSAGRTDRAPILVDLLRRAQERCILLRRDHLTPNPGLRARNPIAIVHAFADNPYDRSSFHIAGKPDCVVDVASFIALRALRALVVANNETSQGLPKEVSRHPFVGVVDHISVMPLAASNIEYGNKEDCEPIGSLVCDTHGQTAQLIGKAIGDAGAKIIYYGSADPQGASLAKVRREKTNFFNSGGLAKPGDDIGAKFGNDESGSGGFGVATVGAPPTFVENFNIRLSSKCSKVQARSLARRVRKRDGGIVGVEALALPYTEGRWEVACNLLQPSTGTSDMILQEAERWAREQDWSHLIEGGYRVGTTADQCMKVLDRPTTELIQHDQMVYERFAAYFIS